MVRKNWNFCNQILQVQGVLDKKLQIFILSFFNIFHCNIPLDRGLNLIHYVFLLFKKL